MTAAFFLDNLFFKKKQFYVPYTFCFKLQPYFPKHLYTLSEMQLLVFFWIDFLKLFLNVKRLSITAFHANNSQLVLAVLCLFLVFDYLFDIQLERKVQTHFVFARYKLSMALAFVVSCFCALVQRSFQSL